VGGTADSWVGYRREGVADLARLTGEVIDHLDGTWSSDPVAATSIRTIRSIAFSLSTTWMPVLTRIGADTSLTEWGAGPPPLGGWTAPQVRGVPAPLVPPVTGGADAVATWWSDLADEDRIELIERHPQLVGNTDGIPAQARNRANRIRMAADLEALGLREAAGTLTASEAQILTNIRRADRGVAGNDDHHDPLTEQAVGGQLYIYDPAAFGGDGRIAIALGDLDAAEHVAVTVSGLGSDAGTIGSEQSQDLYVEARHASGDSVAVLSWMGYDAPSYSTASGEAADIFDEGVDVIGVLDQDAARAGAILLAADVAGLHVMRGGRHPHLTVIGNSYGSTTAAIAADEEDLGADDLVLTGSPGAGDAGVADDLTTGAEHTWVGSASSDIVTYLGETGGWTPQDTLADLIPGVEQLGDDPSEDSFEARRFRAEGVDRHGGGPPGNADDHGDYYDEDSESLYNIAAIVSGQYDLVVEAEHRHMERLVDIDFELDLDLTPFTDQEVNLFPDDSEADRDPVVMTHQT